MDTRDYDEFLLEIHSNKSIQSRLNTHDGYESYATAKVLDDQYLREDISKGILKLKTGELNGHQDELQRLGRNLYQAIFPGEVGHLFEQAVTTVRTERRTDRDRWLRIIVDVDLESDIFNWPLEFLYCESLGYWLAVERPMLALSRRAIFSGTTDLNPEPLPLCVLVIISRPEDNILIKTVLQTIGTLADMEAKGKGTKNMQVQVLGTVKNFERIVGIDYLDQAATYENIHNWVSEQGQPHVLHFIGHGKFEIASQQSFLALENPLGQFDWCSAEDISNLFTDYPPRLVVLQACESATPATADGFMRLSDHLVKRHIPAVVAMQFPISNQYASLFAECFYKALLEGKDVDEAVQSGRWRIRDKTRQYGTHDFGAPVLFSYNPAHIIQPFQSQAFDQKVVDDPLQQESDSEQIKYLLEKALKWLGENGHETDIEQALIYSTHARNILQDEKPRETEILDEALELLQKEKEISIAKSMILNAYHRLAEVG